MAAPPSVLSAPPAVFRGIDIELQRHGHRSRVHLQIDATAFLVLILARRVNLEVPALS
jgi:hypothetical protein